MQRSYDPAVGAVVRLARPGYGAAAMAGGWRGFTSGLLGGLVGAGIGGMLFGHGMFGGIDGGGSIIGLLIQLALIFFIGRWLLRMFFARQPMFAGVRRHGWHAPARARGPACSAAAARRAAPPPLAIAPADYQAFEQLLKGMQAAWSAEDLNALRSVATPEMASYFGEQLAELRSRGLRNTGDRRAAGEGRPGASLVRGSREYATVAMQFSMLDVTRDGSGPRGRRQPDRAPVGDGGLDLRAQPRRPLDAFRDPAGAVARP